MGTAIAGCSSYQFEDDDPQDRIQELEAELARTREENRALNGQIDELQSTLATTQRQLDNVNLWDLTEKPCNGSKTWQTLGRIPSSLLM